MDLDAYIGQAIEIEDPDNLDQCFDWALKVCDLIGIPRVAIRNLYAKDIWTHHDPKYFDVVTGPPQRLDLAIWGASVGVAGHVAVVKVALTDGRFQSWDQNWNGIKTVQLVTHNRAGLLGFLRPKGVNMNATKEQVQVLWLLAVQGEPINQDFVNSLIGKPWDDVLHAFQNDPNIKSHTATLLAALHGPNDANAQALRDALKPYIS